MAVRIISGVVGAAVLLALLALPQPIPPILVTLAGLFAAYEFIILTRAKWGFVVGGLALSAALLSPPFLLDLLAPQAFTAVFRVTGLEVWYLQTSFILVLQVLLALLLIVGVQRGRVISLSLALLFGLPLMVVLPFALLAYFAWVPLPMNAGLLIFVLVLVWAADTGAFACGKLFGKHKLIPRVSPGKTWEGYIGGCFSAACFLLAMSLLAPTIFPGAPLLLFNRMPLGVTVLASVIAGILFGTAALVGDLAFSAIKRSRGVKDSGAFLPGHGGILDRVDGLVVVVLWLVPVGYMLNAVFR